MDIARHHYRSPSSEEDDSGDDEETCWKRQATEGPGGAPRAVRARKVNNVWGSVLQEQILTDTLGSCSVEKTWTNGDRACESYDFRRKALDPRESPPPSPKGIKRPVHERLGKKTPTEDDEVPSSKEAGLAEKLAERLQEPKKDLLERVVRILGETKAQQLLSMTEDIESAGGLLTLDGSRRRTAGGVFFHLIKSGSHLVRSRERRAIFANEERFKYTSKKQPKPKSKPAANGSAEASPKMSGEATPEHVAPQEEDTMEKESLEEGEITD